MGKEFLRGLLCQDSRLFCFVLPCKRSLCKHCGQRGFLLRAPFLYTPGSNLARNTTELCLLLESPVPGLLGSQGLSGLVLGTMWSVPHISLGT